MDLNHLQLENLLYERDHLSRETQLCKDFTMKELNKMEDDEEQGFLEDVDTLQSREEHARNLTILKDQKDKRTNSQLQLEAVQIRVKAATSAVSESKQYLSKLPESLKDVEKALVPLRKNMPWRPGTRRGRHEQAAELPGPLFTLYCQLEAYCDSVLADETDPEDESGPSSLVASYGGSGDGDEPLASVSLVPAKTYVSASAKAAADGPNNPIEAAKGSSSKTSAQHDSSVAAKRQRRHYDQDEGGHGLVGGGGGGEGKRRVSSKEAGRSMLDALKPSAMEILLTLSKGKAKSGATKETNSNNSTSFSIRFSYLPALGIIAACPQTGCPPSLLANLFPNDTGRDTPNPINHHGRAARASASGVFNYPADVQCRPYRWAQWLAGLHFPATAGGGGGGKVGGAIEPSTRAVVAALRSRIRTHMALGVQLKSFVTTGPSPLLAAEGEVPRATGNVELRSWRELSGSEHQQAAKASQERDASTVGVVQGAMAMASEGQAYRNGWERYGARYFKGVLKVKEAGGKDRNVELQVEVPAEYPLRPSLINLVDTGNPAAQEDLCTVSTEVNAHYDTLLTEDVSHWDHLLSNQLILAMECLVTKAGE
ncbi:unnamed protein product [Laminaria digitata]